jgi:hypothetical protein
MRQLARGAAVGDNGLVMRMVTSLALALAVSGGLAGASAAAPAPVVRLMLAEHGQSVRINGVRAGLGGEASAGQAGRIRASLGPRDDCRVVRRLDRDAVSVSRWRAARLLVRSIPLSGEPDCDAPTESVTSIVLSGPAGRVVTERGTVRVGGRVPARLRAVAARVSAFGPRSVIAWPLTEPCTGLLTPGSTALLVRTLRGTIVSTTVYTGILEVVTCAGS